jgi:hypothetical protein
MPVIIDAVPGSTTANSFTTLAFANAYNAGVVGAEGWVDFDTDVKNRALVTATNILSSNVSWIGRRTSYTQALDWPRIWAVDAEGIIYDSTVVPTLVQQATAELARRLAEAGGAEADTTTASIKRLKVASIDVEFKEGAAATPPLPDDVLKMVARLVLRSGGGGMRAVSVIRT